ncbi:hypothetical protein [Amycolatopsis anabasis]|uniref:hypothetical protein n=1 Tax=Amycolatopsis anabasis TaxID=1840409 RepID=UPI0015D19AA8|nr:hypothetical protein [Amycolatopsis anabasis]
MTSSTDTLESDQVSDQVVVDMESGLNELIGRGYQFVHPRNAEGEVVAVVGVRVHDSVIDVVRLHAEDDVIATRMPGDEPDVMVPKKVYWQAAGSVQTVLNEVLTLPEDHVPGEAAAPGTPAARGCWVPGDGARSKWLAAS